MSNLSDLIELWIGRMKPARADGVGRGQGMCPSCKARTCTSITRAQLETTAVCSQCRALTPLIASNQSQNAVCI